MTASARGAAALPGAASHAGFDDVRRPVFERVFRDAIDALETAGIPYLLIGGLATAVVGRPRCSADVDLFVFPADAGRALDGFAAKGFETERINPHWLYKATRESVLVDVLFKGPRDIYLDDAMIARSRMATVMGCSVRVAPAEDLLVMKALVHDEETPRHWHDALAIVASGDLDWEYLLARARKGNHRVLSLLHYAVSNDLAVPTCMLEALRKQAEAEAPDVPLGR